MRANLLGGAGKFAEGAGLRRTGGGTAALAGLAAAAGAGIAVQVIQSSIDYAKALKNLSDQLGITTDDLQAYLKMARDAGVSQEQLTSAFGQFANNLGRAKEGEQDQIKVFKALGVNIKEFASAGDALPTVIDRISQIKDPAHRAAVETRLFGESGRKLDSLLSGGAQGVSALARSLQETGKALSAQEIQELDETARKLAEVKAQLEVDFARVVAGNADAIIGLAGSFATLAREVGDALRKLREYWLETQAHGGITGLGLGQTQGDRDAAGAQLRRLRLSTPEGRARLAGDNFRALDQALFGSEGPRGTSSLDTQRGAMIRNLRATRPNAPVTQEVERLLREQHEIRVAARQGGGTPTPPVQPGTVNPRALANLGTPRGPRGPSAEQLAKEADQRQRRFEDELARAQDDLLRAQRDLATSAEKRYGIDQQSLKTAYDHRLQEIDREATEKQIDASKAGELKAAEKAAYEANLAVLALQHRVELESDANTLRQQGIQAEIDMLDLQADLALTAKDRARIAKERLAKERAAETGSLNAIINSSDPNVSEADRASARAQLASQDARFNLRGQIDARNNEGPFAAYRRRLDRSPDQISEQVESLVVDELDEVRDGITGALTKAIGTKDPLISGLINLLVEQVIMKPIAAALAKAGDGNGLQGLLNSVGSLFGSGGARASGGNVVGGRSYLVGEHGPEIVTMGASGKVYPNGSLPSIRGAGGGATIIAPQHFDLTGVVMTEPLLRQIEARNRDYANAVAAQAGRAAVRAGPARLQKLETLGN